MNHKSYWLVIALALFQAGCSIGTPSRPSQFYVLSAEPAAPVSARSASAEPLSIGLGPVTLPDLFDRPQIVSRPEVNRVELAEFDRWGGDLNKDLSRVLAQNLMSRLKTDDVVLFPWPGRQQPDFQITLRFFRFDGEPGKQVHLDGVWRLLDGREGCELAARRFQIDEPTGGPGYPAFVNAMSRAVAGLSQIIAEQVAVSRAGC